MIPISQIRNNSQEIIDRLARRGVDRSAEINRVLALDEEARAARFQLEQNLSRANQLAREIGDLFKSGKKDEAEGLRQESTRIKEENKGLEETLTRSEQELKDLLLTIPNAPSTQVKTGRSADDNEVVSTHGEIPKLHEDAKPHWDLAKTYDLIDFELGVKITGAGFPVYKGAGARLQRALINFFLDRARDAGYLEIQPPIVVNEESGYGTGQLPDKEGQMYHATVDNLYLIPTAEVPITNIYRDVILEADQLPVKNAGYTPCFRREAGSYGAHVRGLNRLHQFDKVEIVQIARPADSYRVLEEMQEYVQGLLRDLELPYRVLRLCGGDMGFASAQTYDMEVYSAAQEKWLEVSSVSNFESFQANRLKLRYRKDDGKTELAHTLNGSALALPRIVAALLENNQDAEGIRIPKVLVPYTGFDRIQ
ncbi:MAG: serine--tRNA ligase [Bacteroidota bacterium]